jgi:transcriptional regulator with XRE-family HTH domain
VYIPGMSGVANILIVGRQRRGWSQAELAHRASVSVSTVCRAEQDRGLPNVNSLRRLAIAIEYDPDALVSLGKNPKALPPGVTTADRLAGGAKAAWDSFLPPPRSVSAPYFGGVSAVRTDHREEISDGFGKVPDVEMDFVVKVDGQCMEPRFENGERVGCSVRRWQSEGFMWGKDYWIRFKNGETTLKRVKQDPRHRERFLCVPLNSKSKPFARLKSDVASAARVVAVLPG